MLNEKEKKYGETLGLMLKDAREAQDKAHGNLVTLREQKKIAEGELRSLNKAVDKNYREFLSVIKALLKMLFKRPEDPIELEHVLHPVNTYLNALKAIPKAEENLTIVQEQLGCAEWEAEKAQKLVTSILSLQAQYPHPHENENKDE